MTDMEKFNACTLCRPVDRAITSVRAFSIGPRQAKVAIIGKHPNGPNSKNKMIFANAAGRKLDEGLWLANLKIEECYRTNVIKCVPTHGGQPLAQTYINCRHHWLEQELHELNELRLIITLGNQALRCFSEHNTVTEEHGQKLMIQCTCCERRIIIYPTFQPSQALKNDHFNDLFLLDMKNLRKELTNERIL